jgi:hypothetical protein
MRFAASVDQQSAGDPGGGAAPDGSKGSRREPQAGSVVVVVEVGAVGSVVVVDPLVLAGARDAEVSTECLPDCGCEACPAPAHPAARMPTAVIPQSAAAIRTAPERRQTTVPACSYLAGACIRCPELSMTGSSYELDCGIPTENAERMRLTDNTVERLELGPPPSMFTPSIAVRRGS